LIQNQLKTEQAKQTQLNNQIQTLTTQILAINLAPNETTQAALESLQEQLTTAQEALTQCEAIIESYNAAIVQLQNQIQEKQTALEFQKSTNQ
jgi:chromosome segregation ATPase